ncbi:MAG: 30S ribosomal protein S3 [Candidatus Bathyarchaeia archaeon]
MSRLKRDEIMPFIKHFVNETIRKAKIDEFLWKEFERAGYGGVNITKTPLGTNVVIYAMRPGFIIGRGGETIKSLAKILEEKFNLPNPQISVAEIEVPELNPYVMASRIAAALRRGVHFRRVGFWALNQIMNAGALGAEIIISGKLRTERARAEKFRDGYIPKSGEPAMKYVKKAVAHVQLKPGIFGVKVLIVSPEAKFPDEVEILEGEAKGAEEAATEAEES